MAKNSNEHKATDAALRVISKRWKHTKHKRFEKRTTTRSRDCEPWQTPLRLPTPTNKSPQALCSSNTFTPSKPSTQ